MSTTLDYLVRHWDEILGWLAWHAWLSAAPVAIGLVIALPLGWWARRSRFAHGPLIAAAGLLYTIPSLALFVLMPAMLGTKILDPINVIAALTVYSVALLVRVVADGLAAVPDDVQQSATAMGYGSLQRLIAVELPIAVPVIIAGLRVAAVSDVSLVSVSALLGVPQLGQLFTIGFQRFSTEPITLGVLGCLLLALLFDTAIVLTGRVLTPWRSAVRAS
ncbi:MAG TPA: ABC transporter permease subunit [Kineosporiaceae bacterium]|nr:ABC transporter permease subunit [Kineosporiaceae bacterium]